MDQRRGKGLGMKMNFDNFQIQKLISQILKAQKKKDEKDGVIFLVFFYLPKLWSLNYPK